MPANTKPTQAKSWAQMTPDQRKIVDLEHELKKCRARRDEYLNAVGILSRKLKVMRRSAEYAKKIAEAH